MEENLCLWREFFDFLFIFGMIVNVVLGNRKIGYCLNSLKFHSLRGIFRFWCQEHDIRFVNCGFFFKFETQEFYCCLGLRFVEKTSRILWGWFWQLQPISFDIREILLSCCSFGGLNKWVNDCIYKHFELIKVWRFHVREFCQRVKFGIFFTRLCVKEPWPWFQFLDYS